MFLFFLRIYFFCLFIVVNLLVSAQKIDSMLNLYRDNFPQENIHVHFDKNFYNSGETIWFKGYIMSGKNLSGISKNFYAELRNDQGMIIQRVIAPIVGASAASSFTIPANYSKQIVHFRAYTTWMLNFDTSFLYNKTIRVLTGTNESLPTNNATYLQFFPEGGDLIAGIESVLAFKTNDEFGLPVKVNGFVVGANGKKITEFHTRHNGLGSFKFIPEKGEIYNAVWKDSTNKEYTTILPAYKSEGMVLQAINIRGTVTFIVKRSEGNELLKQGYLIAHMDQQLVYRARINLSDNFLISGRVPIDQLPSGILQLTLFNSNWQPMAERIIFVNNNDYIFDAYLRTVARNLNKREKNTIEIEIPDTLLSNLSLAITDATVNPVRENEDNIYSRLLLTGDIKGYVHEPGYYFSSFADSVAQQLDLVMLTHGWRRFNWDNLAQGKFPLIKYPVENYMTLQGSIAGIDPGKLTKDNQLNLIVQLKDSSTQFLTAPIQPGGKFSIPDIVFYDTAKIFYQLNKDKQAGKIILNVENGLWKGYSIIQTTPDFSEGLIKVENSVIAKNRDIFKQNTSIEADRNKKVKMLQEVIVRSSARNAMQKVEDRYTSGLFKGGDGYSFDLTNDVTAAGSMSLFNYLQGRVPGLMINNAMSSNPSLTWRGGSPDLFLNEMRSDPQNLSSISMSDIAYIKVFRPPFMGAIGGGGSGAIAVYTKRGGESRNDDFVGLNKVTVTGYSPVKEFYSPNFAEKNNPLHDFDDLRTTLYWEPYIFLDKERKKTAISFYNNDISKKLRIVIEGVNENGKLTRVESFIE